MYLWENDTSLDGKTGLTKGTNVRLRSDANTSASVLATYPVSGTKVGTLTGRYIKEGSYKWYELEKTTVNKNGWIRNDLLTIAGMSVQEANSAGKNTDDATAQKMLDEIVAQDKETMNNLNETAAMLTSLKSKGVNTAASATKLNTILNRLQERQEALKKSTWGKVKDTISNAWGSVKSWFGLKGLGVVPIVVVGVIALVAGAGTTALVTLKPWKNASSIDLKESKELKELLEKTDPVTATKIREDIKGQLVDAYTTGNRQGSFGGSFKTIAFVAGAFLLAPYVLKFLNELKKR